MSNDNSQKPPENKKKKWHRKIIIGVVINVLSAVLGAALIYFLIPNGQPNERTNHSGESSVGVSENDETAKPESDDSQITPTPDPTPDPTPTPTPPEFTSITALRVNERSGDGGGTFVDGFAGSRSSARVVERVEDFLGTIFENCYILTWTGDGFLHSIGGAHIEFVLNGEFSTFDAVLSSWDGEPRDDYYIEITTEDGVIYQSPRITRQTMPIILTDLDISGQNFLRITRKQVGNSSSRNVLILGDAVVR